MKAQIWTDQNGNKFRANPKRMTDYVNCKIEYREVTEQEIIDLKIPEVWCEVKIPLPVFAQSEKIQQKLAMLNMIYDWLDRRTVDGIIYLSHIDLNDVQQFLTMEEYQLCKNAGVIFDEAITNLYENTQETPIETDSENENNEEWDTELNNSSNEE